MTITDTYADTTNGVGLVPSFEMPGHVLRDLLAGALVAASTDKTLPTLNGVFIEWGIDGELVVSVAATDRFRISMGAWTANPNEGTRRNVSDRGTVSDSGVFLMDRATASDLVKILPKASKRMTVPSRVVCQLVAGQLVITFNDPMTGASWSRDVTGLIGEFPKYRSLVPTDDTIESSRGVSGIAWNPAYMADADKIPHDKNDPIVWSFNDPTRPMLGKYPRTESAISWRYLLMPVRLTTISDRM